MDVKYIPESWNHLRLEFTDEYLEKKREKKEKIKEIKELVKKQKTPIIESSDENEFCLEKKKISCTIL